MVTFHLAKLSRDRMENVARRLLGSSTSHVPAQGHQIRGRGVVSVLRPSAVGRQPRPRLHASGSGAPDGELLTDPLVPSSPGPYATCEKSRRILSPLGRDSASNGKGIGPTWEESRVVPCLGASGLRQPGRLREHATRSETRRGLAVALPGPGNWPFLSDLVPAHRKRSHEVAASPADRRFDFAARSRRRLSGHGARSPSSHPRVTTEPVSAPAMLPGSRSDHLPLLLCVKCERPQERSGGVICGARSSAAHASAAGISSPSWHGKVSCGHASGQPVDRLPLLICPKCERPQRSGRPSSRLVGKPSHSSDSHKVRYGCERRA
jgi:hypothetical protein